MISQRNSSIELLRMLAMLVIVIFHFLARHFGLYVIGSERISQPDLLPELILYHIGGLGVPCFMFISGYYGMKFKQDRFTEMVLQCLFYALISFIGSLICYHVIEKDCFLFLNYWWFMTAYIIIYLLSPGINSQIESLSNKRLLGLIAILYFVTFSGVINKGSQIGGGMSLLCLYLSARWMRIYLPEFWRKHSLVVCLILLLVKFILLYIFYVSHHLGGLPYLGSYSNPLNMLIVGFLVVSVEKMQFYNKVINYLTSGTLAVYLLSESGWGQRFFSPLFPKDNFSFVAFLIGGVIVMIGILLFDKLRLLLFKRMLPNIY